MSKFFFQKPLSTSKVIKKVIVLVCFDTVKAQVNLIGFLKYFGETELNFHHVLKDSLSRFVSQAWEIIHDA